jgi:uncharacterized membrane protein
MISIMAIYAAQSKEHNDMSYKIPPKQQQVVAKEIKSWQQESLISNDLASQLLTRYSDTAKPNVSGALTLIGSILVGLGSLLFVAANWQEIAVSVKLFLIVTAIVASHYFGWRLKFEPGNRPKLGNALLILGCLFYGAGIWLIAQIFNIDLPFGDGILFWAIGTLAATYACRTVPLGCLSALLLGTWSLTKLGIWQNKAEAFQIAYFAVSFAVSLGLAFSLRSRAVAWISLIAGTLFTVAWSGCNQGFLLWGVATFAGFLWCQEKRPLFASPLRYVSTISFLGSLLCATSEAYKWMSNANLENLSIMLFAALTALSIVIWRVEKYRYEAIVALMLALAACFSYGYAEGATRALSNILLLSTIAGLVYTGLNRIQSVGLVNVAVVFFVIDVIARYFDFFYTMMNRSLFFIVGGIILMVVGSLAESGRRKMIEGIHTRPEDTSLKHAW